MRTTAAVAARPASRARAGQAADATRARAARSAGRARAAVAAVAADAAVAGRHGARVYDHRTRTDEHADRAAAGAAACALLASGPAATTGAAATAARADVAGRARVGSTGAAAAAEAAAVAVGAFVARRADEQAARDVDAIVVVTSGCGTTLKDYGRWPGGEAAARQGALVRDVTEWLDALGVRPDGSVPRYRVAYHDACSLQHGQRVTEAPRRVLSAAGFDLHEVPERHFCCGSAGTFHLLQPELSRTLGKRKGGHVDAVGADIAAAGNLGCIVQINRHAATPIVHTVELVDWATGGPRPEALAGMALRAPRTEAVPPAHTDHPISPPAAGGDVGVW